VQLERALAGEHGAPAFFVSPTATSKMFVPDLRVDRNACSSAYA
jgi:hypothetical protein